MGVCQLPGFQSRNCGVHSEKGLSWESVWNNAVHQLARIALACRSLNHSRAQDSHQHGTQHWEPISHRTQILDLRTCAQRYRGEWREQLPGGSLFLRSSLDTRNGTDHTEGGMPGSQWHHLCHTAWGSKIPTASRRKVTEDAELSKSFPPKSVLKFCIKKWKGNKRYS